MSVYTDCFNSDTIFLSLSIRDSIAIPIAPISSFLFVTVLSIPTVRLPSARLSKEFLALIRQFEIALELKKPTMVEINKANNAINANPRTFLSI